MSLRDRIFNFPFSKCPYCGGCEITIKQSIHGIGEYYVNLETGEVASDHLHDYLYYKNTRKYAICSDCGKRLFKVDEDLNVLN